MTKMRVADYVAQLLVDHGVTDVFMVTGGGAMHLNDALGGHPGLKVVPCHHEQACAMAAESYARLSGRLCAVNVTSGPGGTNALTGVFGAWTDSVPLLVISGQVKRETMVGSTDLPLRQLGDQEIDIVRIMSSVTKYAAVLDEPRDVRKQVERALWEATNGRPGPVWLDIPIDVQSALVEPAELEGFEPASVLGEFPAPLTGSDLDEQVDRMLVAVAAAERPVVLAGGGVRAAGTHGEFLRFVDGLGVPVVTGWNAHDLLWDDHELYAGRPGTVGTRPGNFAVQNADLLIVLGSRLNIRQVGYAWDTWARSARVIMVDVDAAELAKPTLHVDQPVHADLREFFASALPKLGSRRGRAHGAWLAWCRQRLQDYPAVSPDYADSSSVNPYVFVDRLTRLLPTGQVTVCGDGTACVVTFQAARVKSGQRLYTNSGAAPMGYDVPAAVGAAIALGREQSVVCLAGDGSLMMNVQELATIRGHDLNVKLFVLNNAGYHSIRQTQNNYFPGREVGCGTESGVWFPQFERLAAAFEIPFSRVASNEGLDEVLANVLAAPGPQLCEVVLDLDQQFAPKAASRMLPDGRMVSAPLEDLAPFLDRDELRSNMLVPLLDQ
jgi:acetolactate synthase I/II/III large subunit